MKKGLLILLMLLSIKTLEAEKPLHQVKLFLGGAESAAFDEKPWNLGSEYCWSFKNHFTISTGFIYITGFGTHETWEINNIKYNWDNGEDFLILLTLSGKYSTPSLSLKNKGNLSAFIEPGIMYNPFPTIYMDERIEDQNEKNNYALKGNCDWLNLFWQTHFGVTYTQPKTPDGIIVKYEISYFLSNIDYFKQYRDLTINEKALNEILPKEKISHGARLALILQF
jgi:hypothetical protein